MKHSFTNILRFLFPEWQIIEAIQEEGVFAGKDSSVRRIKQSDAMHQEKVQEEAASTVASGHLQADKAQDENSDKKVATTAAVQKKNAKYKPIEEQLRHCWMASERDVYALVQAFMRPYIVGIDSGMPKNTILLTGDDGRGKTGAVMALAKIMKEYFYLDDAGVAVIDCVQYTTSAEEELFLSDLYKALYDSHEIVVFKNIEKANYKCLEIISQLNKTGAYRLQKRYVHQNGMLFDASGVLNTSTISELKGDGKYFVFTSDMSVDQVAEHCGSAFMNELNDVVALEPMSSEQLERLISAQVVALIEEAEHRLKLALSCHESCNMALRRSYNSGKGIRGIERIIDEDIYKALKEYRLMHPV